MANPKPKAQNGFMSRKRLLLLAVALLFLYVLLPHVGDFKTSLSTLGHSKVDWLIVCLLGVLLSYGLAATTYILLAKQRLRYIPTVLVQIASMFTNRLLPAGVGAISVSYTYLRRQKHTSDAAAAVVAVNNLLGFLGHLLLFVGVLIFAHKELPRLTVPDHMQVGIGIAVVVVLLIAGYLLLRSKRRTAGQFFRRTLKNIASYRKNPFRFLTALGCSMLLTSSYVLILFASAQAIGLHLAVVDIFIVLTFGVAGATAVPTPGGLGGAEASIVGGFVLYGVSTGDALAAALLYRLFTYWFALVFGGFGFVAARRLRYI